ncbi:MAG: SDR family NAD(P)-dependent oxidoreductase [Pseudomonadota bacterium]
MRMQDLKGKQVLITGAGSGIGRAAVLAFARRGAHILAADIQMAPLDSLRPEVEALGVNFQGFVVDVSSEMAMRQFAHDVHAKVGAVDVLINNAGIAYLGRFLDSDLDHWDRILKVNLMGVVYGCRFFIPAMIAAGGARQVVNVASSVGLYPAPSMAAYAASKHAVLGLTEVLKMEMGETNVRFTSVCPGLINTAIVTTGSGVSPTFPAAKLATLQAHYKQAGCSPDEVAEDMLHAVQGRQSLCLTGPGAALLYHTRRISLALVRWAMEYNARKIGYL